MDLSRRHQAADAVRSEGLEWLEKLTSGEATRADAEALLAWRTRSPAHAAALRDAMEIRRACETLKPQDFAVAQPSSRRRETVLSRRAVLGGAVAAGGAGAAILASQRLLPSAPKADYETGPGDRRGITLANGCRLELGTKTRIAWLRDRDRAGVTLLGGELFVRSGVRPFAVVSANGRILADNAAFNIRRDADATHITCAEGDVGVSSGHANERISAGQQIAYDARGLGPATPVDVASVTAWRQGLLIFRNVKLRRVVTELNRYRAQPILLAGSHLGDRTVYAVFRTDRSEAMVTQISHLSGAKALRLPGGVILLA
jgi:transmembrane sensor